jgi:hypothetical protein
MELRLEAEVVMLNGRPHIKVTQGPFVVGRYGTVAEMERVLGDKVALLHMRHPAA